MIAEDAIAPAQPDARVAARKRRRLIFILVFAGVLLAAGIAGGAALQAWRFWGAPGPAAEQGEQTLVYLPPGSGFADVVEILKTEGVLSRIMLFRLAARLTDAHRDVKAGEYAVPSETSPQDLLALLVSGRTHLRRITVPEGLTSRQIVRLLGRERHLSGAVDVTPEEGSLLPDTYAFERGEARMQLLTRMRRAHDEVLMGLWRSRDSDLPYASPYQAVIMASIIEKETGLSAERRRVAAVFVNRLKKRMRLQSDPTVIYAVNNGDPLGRGLRASELRIDSPYNTYRVRGLPPGPIANPGRAALEAAFDPEDTDVLYFVADGSGGHVFARTYEEHQRNVARWREIERAEDGDGR